MFFFLRFTGEISDSILNSFSIIKSGKELLKYDKNNDLNIIGGLKVLTMLMILFGHRFMYLVGNPISYPKNIENVSRHWIAKYYLLNKINLHISINIWFVLLLHKKKNCACMCVRLNVRSIDFTVNINLYLYNYMYIIVSVLLAQYWFSTIIPDISLWTGYFVDLYEHGRPIFLH